MTKRDRFTLIEMLVVVAIIGVLAALLMPALMSAIGTARGLQCANNLRQQGLVVFLYSEEIESCIPPVIRGGDFITISSGGPYGDNFTFMTVLQAYQAGKPNLSDWGQAGGPYDETYICPNDQNPANHLNQWSKKNISYGVNNYAFSKVNGRSVPSDLVRRLNLIRHPGQTAYLADCQNNATNLFGVNPVSGNVSTKAYFRDAWGQNLVGMNATQGLTLRHNDMGYNSCFLDGHVEPYIYPAVPVSFSYAWCSNNN